MALLTPGMQNNASDNVVFNITRRHNAARRAHCSYGKGPFFTSERNNMMSRDVYKYSGYRAKALSVGRTKPRKSTIRKDENYKAFTVFHKRKGGYRTPATTEYKHVITAQYGPKWRASRPAGDPRDFKDPSKPSEENLIHSEGGYVWYPKKEIVTDKKTGEVIVRHGPKRNYQREWIKRSVQGITKNRLYRCDLSNVVQRRIWKHLENDARKRRERRAAAKYYNLWAGDEEEEDAPSKDTKAVNNEDLVEVD